MSTIVTFALEDLSPETAARIINDLATQSQHQKNNLGIMEVQASMMEVELETKDELLKMATDYTENAEKIKAKQQMEIEHLTSQINMRKKLFDEDGIELNRRQQRINLLEQKLKMFQDQLTVMVRIVIYNPDRKIDTIKMVRQFTGLGLSEAKRFVEGESIVIPEAMFNKFREALMTLEAQIRIVDETPPTPAMSAAA